VGGWRNRTVIVPGLKLRYDALRERFAEFNAPLVEGVDAPDSALRENDVFVKGDQLAERFRRQPVGQDRVRRPVTLEDAMWRQFCSGAFGFHLLGCLAKGERLGLCKNISQQNVVMPA
jgi:hypothetical protein